MDKLFYNFQPLPRDVIERTSDDASKHIVAQLFNKSMPQFQTGISEMLGGFAKTFEETDPDIMDKHLYNLRDNEEIRAFVTSSRTAKRSGELSLTFSCARL